LNLHISYYCENRRAQWRPGTKRQKEKSKRFEKKENWENGETSSLYFHVISVREDTYHPWGNVKSMQNFYPKLSRDEAIFMPRFDMTSILKWFFYRYGVKVCTELNRFWIRIGMRECDATCFTVPFWALSWEAKNNAFPSYLVSCTGYAAALTWLCYLMRKLCIQQNDGWSWLTKIYWQFAIAIFVTGNWHTLP
jgi:hypothetical protein